MREGNCSNHAVLRSRASSGESRTSTPPLAVVTAARVFNTTGQPISSPKAKQFVRVETLAHGVRQAQTLNSGASGACPERYWNRDGAEHSHPRHEGAQKFSGHAHGQVTYPCREQIRGGCPDPCSPRRGRYVPLPRRQRWRLRKNQFGPRLVREPSWAAGLRR